MGSVVPMVAMAARSMASITGRGLGGGWGLEGNSDQKERFFILVLMKSIIFSFSRVWVLEEIEEEGRERESKEGNSLVEIDHPCEWF